MKPLKTNMISQLWGIHRRLGYTVAGYVRKNTDPEGPEGLHANRSRLVREIFEADNAPH